MCYVKLLNPQRYKRFAWENFSKSKPYATGKMKQAVISPSMMYLLYPLNSDIDGYPKAEFMKDLVDEVRRCSCAT